MSSIYEKTIVDPNKAIIFHTARESMIGIKTHQKLELYSSSTTSSNNLQMLSKFIAEEEIDTIENLKLKNVLEFFGKKVLVVDASGIYDLKNYKPEIILLRNSPKINLEPTD